MGKVQMEQLAEVVELHPGLNKKMAETFEPVDPPTRHKHRLPTKHQVREIFRLSRLSVEELADELNVGVRTINRWKSGGSQMPSIYYSWIKQIAIGREISEFAGNDWIGFSFRDGYLYTDSGYKYTAGQIRAIFMYKQMAWSLDSKVTRLEKEISELKSKLEAKSPREVDKQLARDIDLAMDRYFSWHHENNLKTEY